MSLKGDKKCRSAGGQALPCRGEELGRGTPPSPTWTRNPGEGKSPCCPPSPGRTAPRGPWQVPPSLLCLPGRRSSEVGRAWLGRSTGGHIRGGGGYSGPPEPAWGGPGAARQWLRHGLAISGQLSFSPWSPLHSPACAVSQSYLVLCNPMDYSLPGSSVRGINLARILGWVTSSSSRPSS